MTQPLECNAILLRRFLLLGLFQASNAELPMKSRFAVLGNISRIPNGAIPLFHALDRLPAVLTLKNFACLCGAIGKNLLTVEQDSKPGDPLVLAFQLSNLKMIPALKPSIRGLLDVAVFFCDPDQGRRVQFSSNRSAPLFLTVLTIS